MNEPPFEQQRFRTAAQHYLTGRPPYAAGLFDRIVQLCGLGPGDRVMDLGCGPGPIARALAPRVAEVVAIDPSAEMLAIARGAGAEAANIVWHQGSSDDLPGAFGRFKLVTMGRSFHWMDREETLRRLDQIVAPGGAIALLTDQHPEVPDNAWYPQFRAILERYSGDDSFRVRRKGPGWVSQQSVLLASAFARLEEIGVYERLTLPAETLVERALSMSSTSRARLRDRADAMIAEIHAAWPDGTLHEVVISQATLAWRP